MKMLRLAAAGLLTWLAGPLAAQAADPLNVYTIWPENYARPMFQEFEKTTGIKVNFLRFSSGEALARVIAEKNNPRVDVLFGGPVETFAAGIKEGIFEPYKSPSFAQLPTRFKQADGQWTAIADDPLVFMTNAAFLKSNNLQPPQSWNDLLNPAYKNQLQMADALIKGAKNPDAGKKLIDFATSAAMQSKLAEHKVNFVPANPDVKTDPAVAEVLKGANVFPIDDEYAGANRKRIVERWVKEVLGPQ